MARVFVYDGREFPDPDSGLSVEDVRKQLSDFFPELTNAETREERRGDDEVRYTFARRIGTKGAGHPDIVTILRRVPEAAGSLRSCARNWSTPTASSMPRQRRLASPRSTWRSPRPSRTPARPAQRLRRSAASLNVDRPPDCARAALRPTPVTPTSVAALLDGHAAQVEFRRIVEEIFPDAAAEIWLPVGRAERRSRPEWRPSWIG